MNKQRKKETKIGLLDTENNLVVAREDVNGGIGKIKGIKRCKLQLRNKSQR